MLAYKTPLPRISNAIRLDTDTVWAQPVSLAATKGVVITFLSSGYLDVSVPPVPSTFPIYSGRSTSQ
jgi:hypothetical protein